MYVFAIETILVVTPAVTGELVDSISATPPNEVVPTPLNTSSRLYAIDVTS